VFRILGKNTLKNEAFEVLFHSLTRPDLGTYQSEVHIKHVFSGNPSKAFEVLFHSLRRPDLKYLDLQICVVFLDTLLSDGDSVYLHENLFVILGFPEKTCLICTGTPGKSCWKFWLS